MKIKTIAIIISSVLASHSYAYQGVESDVLLQDNVLSFLDCGKLISELDGDLNGAVKFAQTHTINAKNNGELELPRLVSNRESLLMFIPLLADNVQSITMSAYDGNNNLLGSIALDSPELLPEADRLNKPTASLPDVVYTKKAWSGNIPWRWVKPGLNLVFTDNNGREGSLADIDIGAENEIMIQNIRLGLLTPPVSNHRFEQESILAADFFQKVPVSKIIVGNYSPMYFEKIVLSNGTVYTDHSAVEGGVYSGDMRENIAKNLISMGINNANFGITSSDGVKHWQPAYFNQYVVHKARGKYTNGLVNHGLSGGNGMATLINTVGNEFSHELGHAFGMGHYPGGGQWATHNEDSGWGWDALNKRFIANFFWNRTGNAESQGYVTPPFSGIYQFNRDSMGGGSASSPLSQYTLYTGYTQKRIQAGFERTGRVSETTESGYRVWDEDQQAMVERNDPARLKPVEYGKAVTTLVGFYDPKDELLSYIYPALNGSYGHVYDFGTVKGGQCWVDVTYQNGDVQQIGIDGSRINASNMNKFHFNIPTDKTPIFAQVSCPAEDPMVGYEAWRYEYLNTTEFKTWEYTWRGVVGDIYRTGDGKRYFKLLQERYGYFPSGSSSKPEWEFMGYETDIRSMYQDTLADLPYDAFGVNVLDSRQIVQPEEQPKPPVLIGEEFGYKQVKSSVEIFKHGEYSGISELIEEDTAELNINNNVSSLVLGNETIVTLFDGKKFTGDYRIYRENTSFLTGFNDKASSATIIDTRQPYACVYEDSNFQGKERCFTGVVNDVQFETDISSVKVFNGAVIDLFSGANITGEKLTINEDMSDLGNFDDIGSSVRFTPSVCVYQHGDFGGSKQCYTESVPQLSPNNSLSSITVFNGASIELFDKANFSGPSVSINESMGWVEGFNDKASSLLFTEVIMPEVPTEPELPTNPPVDNTELVQWDITLTDGESALSTNFVPAGYRQNVYFVTLTSTVYGAKGEVKSGESGYTQLKGYAVGTNSNRPTSIKFRAMKVTEAGSYQMNDSMGGEIQAKLKLSFHASDNPTVKAGEYQLMFLIHARDPNNSAHNKSQMVNLTLKF